MAISNYPSLTVKEFGEKVNMAMYEANIQQSLGGLGGCCVFDINNFDSDVRPYIEEYLQGNLDSVAITYAAMRTKELQESQEYDEMFKHVLTVEVEPDYWSRGHFYVGKRSHINTLEIIGLEIGTKLYAYNKIKES